ncbi:MAG: hypothetical protein SFX18_15080 [Pirellulales bacterium]|nr:hypothetical protein [Pirellulales bacterium]
MLEGGQEPVTESVEKYSTRKLIIKFCAGIFLGLVGLVFAVLTIAILIACLAQPLKIKQEGLFLLAVMGLLAIICLQFCYGFLFNRKSADGNYLSPWTIGVFGILLFSVQLAMTLNDQDWKSFIRTVPISLLMIISWLVPLIRKLTQQPVDPPASQ